MWELASHRFSYPVQLELVTAHEHERFMAIVQSTLQLASHAPSVALRMFALEGCERGRFQTRSGYSSSGTEKAFGNRESSRDEY